MEKTDPGIDFQCPATFGHGSGHSIKNPELGPVSGFLLSKKKRGKYKSKNTFCFAQLPPNRTQNRKCNTHWNLANATPLSVSPPAATTHRHRCGVDRPSPSTNLLPSSVNSFHLLQSTDAVLKHGCIFISRLPVQNYSSVVASIMFRVPSWG